MVALAAALGALAGSAGAQPDPHKIRTAEACGECHLSEYQVWKETEHARGFKTLHRRAAAEAIAESMGIRLLKRDSLCLRCHYTATEADGGLRAVSGVSCESCHGAGAEWIDVHNDYGGKGIDFRSETPEHRGQRVSRSLAAGMRRPSDDLYDLAASCYGCHTVPEERLVNVGGHGTGSAGFELAEWTQGENRHNFLASLREGDGTVNATRPPERLRRLYVLGRALDVEHALRGLASASSDGVYAKAMSRRLRGAVGELRAIARRLRLAELETMLDAVRGVDAIPGNGEALRAAADRVGEAARRFLAQHTTDDLSSIDPLRLGQDETVLAGEPEGTVPEAAAGIAPAAPGTAVSGAAAATAASGAAAATAASGAAAATAASGSAAATAASGAAAPGAAARSSRAGGASGAVPAVGAVKTRIRRPPAHAVVGPATCGGCHRHRDQNRWWLGDAHAKAADPFFEERPENVRIALLYGLETGDILRGDRVCMDCHGTVVTGRERREIQDGVGCEACHGAAGDYLEPHQEGDPALGTDRPGYRKAMALGMVELEDLAARARVCTDCHDIVDPRLISSGHPTGRDFDYAGAMAEIRHWDHPDAEGGQVRQAFAAAVRARGAVPDVPRARQAGAAPGSDVETPSAEALEAALDIPAPGGVGTAPSSRANTRSAPRGGAGPRPRPRPAARAAAAAPVASAQAASVLVASAPAAAGSLGLPTFPAIDPEAPIAETLRMLQARLALLYRSVAPSRPTDEGDR